MSLAPAGEKPRVEEVSLQKSETRQPPGHSQPRQTIVTSISDISSSSNDNDGSEGDPEPTEAAHFVPPDGGLIAWSQVLACLLTNAMAIGYPGAYGVYQLYYREVLGLPSAQVSWIGSAQVFLAFIMCTASGRLADAGYARATIAAGALLTVLGTLLTSVAQTYAEIFLAQGLCTGVGLGLLLMPGATVVNSYFVRKRSSALSVAATGGGFGSVIFACTIQYLIPRVGFPWAVRCSGLVALAMAALALALLRPRLAPRRAGPLVEWSAFREPPYVLFTVGCFLIFWAIYFGFFYINTFARTAIGFSDTDSVQLLLILNALSVPSRPFVGFIADRATGPMNLLVVAALVLAGMAFAWIGVTTRAGMYAFAVFFGLSNGGVQGVFPGSLASLTADPRCMGTRFGMVLTIVAFATLAGPTTAGAIIDRFEGRYLFAQLWAGLVIALGALTVAASRCWKSGMRLKVKI